MRVRRFLPLSLLVTVFGVVALPGLGAEVQEPQQDVAKAKPAQVTTVVIIGTLEQGHNTAKKYTTSELRRILLALHPAAICVEMFSNPINADGTTKEEVLRTADSPEIAIESEVAKALGIKQVAFEREDRNENWAKTKYWEHQRRANDRSNRWSEKLAASEASDTDRRIAGLLEEAAQAQHLLNVYAPAEVINSQAHDSVVRIKHSLFEVIPAIMAKYPEYDCAEDWKVLLDDWQERNRIMADNITRIAAQYPGKTIAVTTGAEHRYMLRKLLADKPGIVLKEFWEVPPQG